VACLYLDAVSIQELYNTLFIPSIKGKYEIVFNESFDITTKDFKNLVAKVKQSKPDVIFINGWENHLTQIIKEAINQGLKQDENMVFTFDLLDAVKYLTAEQLNGLVANVPLYEIETTQLKTDWKARFKAKYNMDANYSNAYAYDYAMIMFEIVKKYAQSGDKKFDINKYIFNTNKNGITGNLSFSKSGDLIGVYKTCKYENGQFIPLDK
jgi:ABC-type branched-subunit amino acid transport system substrate-binding protein